MANTHVYYEQFLFDVTDEAVTRCYVFIRAEPDAPFMMPGWHCKEFPASMTTQTIFEALWTGGNDPMLWPNCEAPVLKGANQTPDCVSRIAQVAPAVSHFNYHRIKPETPCGCYFCLTTFKGSDIENWVDRSALCPRCGINAVLPDIVEPAVLEAAHTRWFCSGVDEAPPPEA